MNIEQLKYIVEISHSSSLKTAATKLNISLPALSQSVTKLEKELNIEIFHRSRKGTYPTEEGKILIQKATGVLEKFQEFLDEAESFAHILKGELKIATFPGPLDLLADQITLYKKEFPYIKASIEEDNSQHIIEKVKKRK
ncbi:LysR family transcriptional regulator [Niallia circulans]